MNRLTKFFLVLGISFLIAFMMPKIAYAQDFRYSLDTDGELIIVIDPGHGGSNLGANHNGFLEKEMNMIVANAMCEELSKYDGITVYLTHSDTETDMSIQERADFAASVNADFLFCLHFNMSPGNILFGSEVWVSAFGEENREGYRFACVQMEVMEEMGLFIRGVKTRFNERGTDYYGILRFCEEYDIPAALIEHCHIDHDADVGFCDSEEDLIAFGVVDATAVAKYFGLKSEVLSVDYSDYALKKLSPGTLYVQADTSDPDICMIEKDYVDEERNVVGIRVSAYDYDTPILYYSYSIDGGETFTPYFAWPGTDVMERYSPDTFTFEIEVPYGVSPIVVVRAVNQYDRYTESNILSGLPVFSYTPAEIVSPDNDVSANMSLSEQLSGISGNDASGNDLSAGDAYTGFKAPEKEPEEEEGFSVLHFLYLCLGIAGTLFAALLISNMVISAKRRQKRKSRKRK